jgi:FlaA1/EpsC-like NDP-sugar epimerase
MKEILGRDEFSKLIRDSKQIDFKGFNILITGAKGSIGERLVHQLELLGAKFTATDIEEMDVLKPETFIKEEFTHVINLAASKHAPLGESEVELTFSINTLGTINLLKAYPNAKHILTSTCKACNPETVYGASKLIAERLVLNSGGSVARFYNVVPSAGNVFEIWKDQDPINVAYECNRFFISINEAVALTMFAITQRGRIMVDVPEIRNMLDVAKDLYSDKVIHYCKPRRGDRLTEKRYADHEYVKTKIHPHINLVESHND